MSLFDPAPHGSPRAVVAEHPAHGRLRRTSGRLGRRLLTVNAAVAALVLLLTYTLDRRVATPVAGAYTLGMLLLSLQAATMLISALWYDRACRDLCAPHADELHAAVPGSGERA